MKPLYGAPVTAPTSTGPDGTATPSTPVPPPNAPGEDEPWAEKLLTKRPELPMLISSKFVSVPKEFRVYADSYTRGVFEQPPVTTEAGCWIGPTRNGCAWKLTAEPCVVMFTPP